MMFVRRCQEAFGAERGAGQEGGLGAAEGLTEFHQVGHDPAEDATRGLHERVGLRAGLAQVGPAHMGEPEEEVGDGGQGEGEEGHEEGLEDGTAEAIPIPCALFVHPSDGRLETLLLRQDDDRRDRVEQQEQRPEEGQHQ
ncbi:hypothetical protein ABZ192_08070 [Streptomyces sp. NPDC006235]|uniref:hypothetical protein n=1 Tax=Streptomyces sp. NPDC006235 TaxID=3156736 RepID=UPI0033A57CCA